MTGGRTLVAALAVTQTVGYGCVYYSFAVLLGPVSDDLGASRTAVTGAFTVAVLTTALMAVPVGRWLDRHGSHLLMTAGSASGSLLLVALSQVESLLTWYLIWTGLGVVAAMALYEAAFATVIARTPARRRADALLAITVVAGFASTIFLPLTGYLVHAHGWRTATLLLGAGHAAVTVPLHALALRRPPRAPASSPAGTVAPPRPDGPADGPAHGDRRDVARQAVRDRRFWLLAVAFTGQSAATSSMTLHVVGFLVAAGHPATVAAGIGGLLGVLSVAGRLVVTGLQRRFAVAGLVAVVFAVQAVAAAALPALAVTVPGAALGMIGYGIGFGVGTIARPALLTQLFGTTAYGTLSGRLAAPVTVAIAGAPLATAALHRATGSYVPVLLTIAACEALASLSLARLALTSPNPP